MIKFVERTFIYWALIIYLVTGLAGLYVDVLNTDGINWHTRSGNFMEALLTGDLTKTYQSYHPGITLMWISGPALRLFSNYLSSIGLVPYSYDTYLVYDYIAKFSVLVFTSLLFVFCLSILDKIITKRAKYIFALLLIFEPFVLGQRRLYHLDFLMSLLIFCSFISMFCFCQKDQSKRYIVFSALFAVLGYLTKSSGIVILPILFVMLLLAKTGFRQKILSAVFFSVILMFFTYLFVPALWVDPIGSGRKIYDDVSAGAINIGYLGKKEVGFSGSKANVTLDEVEKNGDLTYYLKALVYTFTPVSLAVLALSLISTLYCFLSKHRKETINIFSFVAVLLFLVVMSISNKKGLRYGVVFFPFLFLVMANFLSVLKMKVYVAFICIYVLSLIPQYVQIYPYFYAYADPLFGGVKSRVRIFKPGSLGVATYAVDKLIKQDSRNFETDFGVSAFKSLKMINKKGSVKTSFSCSEDYVVTYALDKNASERCGGGFFLVGTVEVGNLDYWSVYSKRR